MPRRSLSKGGAKKTAKTAAPVKRHATVKSGTLVAMAVAVAFAAMGLAVSGAQTAMTIRW